MNLVMKVGHTQIDEVHQNGYIEEYGDSKGSIQVQLRINRHCFRPRHRDSTDGPIDSNPISRATPITETSDFLKLGRSNWRKHHDIEGTLYRHEQIVKESKN
jgi:hypothetical protein